MNFDHGNRPYPPPSRPHAMWMTWRDLLFMHWPVKVGLLRPHVPSELTIETFEGEAWIGIVPFEMRNTRARFTPPVPFVSNFPELNVRTYVTMGGKPGVWFFSLDASSWLAVEVARHTFHLNYCHARMKCERKHDQILYSSRRTHHGLAGAEFDAIYGPTAPIARAIPGTLEHFLTDRYCLYADRNGTILRGEIAHEPWPLQAAETEVRFNTMTDQLGFRLPDTKPLLHFAERLDVAAWLPEIAAD
jgi:uncharacterized protein YqjF (DUF2071 family)